MEVVADRTAATLMPRIVEAVPPGATVASDMWKAYGGLEAAGFTHETVDHSKHYVDPVTKAHTQRIESLWHTVKAWLTVHGLRHQKAHRDAYIKEWCFRHNHGDLRDWRTLVQAVYRV
jgi:hypothetical protein